MNSFEAPETIEKLIAAGTTFLESLSPEQRAKALMEFEDKERRNWNFIPMPFRAGLPLIEMDAHQQSLALRLMVIGTSLDGYAKATAVMGLDNVLIEYIKTLPGGNRGRDMSLVWGSLRYYFSFFGNPEHGKTWGFRVIGHHLALNFTIADGKYLSTTPSLMGAQPASVGPIRPLREEEELGFALLNMLNSEQHQKAYIHHVSPADLVTKVVERLADVEMPTTRSVGQVAYRLSDSDREALKYVKAGPKGIAGADLDGLQYQMFQEIITCFLNRSPLELASKRLRRVQEEGLENFHFAWAGATDYSNSHYMRIQGPSFLVELENTQWNGNHIHALFRDPAYDFGDDMLLHHQVEEGFSAVVAQSMEGWTRPLEATPVSNGSNGHSAPVGEGAARQ